jgi:hypothetical protein
MRVAAMFVIDCEVNGEARKLLCVGHQPLRDIVAIGRS